MKIYITTDMEAVAGVVTLPEYCLSGPSNKYGRSEGGKYYEHARELATREVNAAVEGLLEGGATEVFVRDAHGHVGLNASLIHPEARILTGKGQVPPWGLDESFDAMVMLGQHAKAHTDGGHLCHSGSFDRDEWLLNGESFGEIALIMIVAGCFDMPVAMISGDVAGCLEARQLVPSIVTVPVIEGQKRGSTKGMPLQEAIDFNVAAIHVSPQKAREMIRAGARQVPGKAGKVERFWIEPPYEMVRVPRPREDGVARRAVNRADNFIELMSQPIRYEPTS